MKKQIATALVLGVGLMAPYLVADRAEAIPTFARQYKTECKTCHTIYPERNEFGDAFEKNSFVWPGKGAGQKIVKPKAGVEVKEEKIEALWNSGIPSVIPISFLAEHMITYNSKSTPRLNLDAETAFETFTAGSLQDKLGFWAEYNFSENAVGEVFAQFRNPLNIPLNVKVGKMKPKLSLWKSNDRLFIGKDLFNKQKADDADFEIFGEHGAIEVNSVIGKRMFVAAGITDSTKGKENGKNWYGHVSARLIGSDFLGNEPEVDLDKDTFLDYLNLTIGGFGIGGTTVNEADLKNDFYRAGIESEIVYKFLRVKLGGIIGKDDNFDGSGISQKTRIFTSQASYFITPELAAALRYEFLDNDQDGITRRLTPSVSYSVLQSTKLVLEYEHLKDSAGTDNTATLMLALSF